MSVSWELAKSIKWNTMQLLKEIEKIVQIGKD